MSTTIPRPVPHGAVSFPLPPRIFSRLTELAQWFSSAKLIGGARDAVSFLLRLLSRPIELFGWFSSVRSARQVLGVNRRMQGQRKALLIGINCATIGQNGHQEAAGSMDWQHALRGPQKDAWDLSRLLIEVYGYEESEITVLIDDKIAGHVQPTRDNVIQGLQDLVRGAAKGDQFFFHFAGHSTQMATDDPMEDDGQDELIVTADHKLVLDDDLNKYLVSSLPAGSSMVAVLDSCHSGTLLDLLHIRCNRVYVPWVSQDVGSLPSPLPTPLSPDSLVVESPLATSFFEQCQTQPPQSVCCTGWCRGEPPLALPDGQLPVEADVISLSSAKDGQRSWEDKDGNSMTQALIRVLRENSKPSLQGLLTLVSHELHKPYLELHDKGRVYKEKVRIANEKRRLKGQRPGTAVMVETDNFQDPQISSPEPLDMTRPWKI